MNTSMKPRTVIGVLFVVASLLKLATLWGILHWSWFETMSEGRWAMYFCIFILLCVGVHLIIDSYRRDPDQWLQRPLPIGEDGKRIRCSVHYGGDEYVYHGETFHGARLDAFCGGIRLDLREAAITEDEEIDIHTFCGGIELFVPTTVNVDRRPEGPNHPHHCQQFLRWRGYQELTIHPKTYRLSQNSA